MKITNEEILELWHTSHIAGHDSRYDRMLYVQSQLKKQHPDISAKKIWLQIGDVIS